MSAECETKVKAKRYIILLGFLKGSVTMINEEFQKIVLHELKTLRTDINEIKVEQKSMSTRQDEMSTRQDEMSTRQDEIYQSMSARQDEIYQVVRAIEHSNQVGRSELDNQNIRLAKVEGKLKKVAKAYNEDVEVDKASNL